MAKRIGLALSVFLLLGLTGCQNGFLGIFGCSNDDIEWEDALKLNDISYYRYYDNNENTATVTDSQLGEKIGKIRYAFNNNSCSNYKLKNGEAFYLAKGTPIYELRGYKSNFRVVADHAVYEVGKNPHARTLGDLWDIQGRVTRVTLQSGIDDSPLGEFTPTATSSLIDQLLPLSYVGFEAVYPKIKQHPTGGVLLRIHLQDGTSFRADYHSKANAFLDGAFATEAIQELILTEQSHIEAAAGL
ncbi:hypothetical protein [Cohnella yongneupensis]|uniref:Lipoprotein n=1 Tax=Cohnella yongneupensis TaxID=425006 RepID=A0ABW0R4D1_9BACL